MSASSQPPRQDSLLSGFAPVIDRKTEILILGSFPGVASLTAQQYYAHPRNQFWRLLSALIGEDLVALPYTDRLDTLLFHHIGVWDVIDACAREGSLDSAIRAARHNDYAQLRQLAPALTRIGFNGKTAGKQEAHFAEAGFQTFVLPSSSPAYAAMTFEQKLAVWRGIML
ncbi:DNA-deoxyinosine glycosylase [Herminiimonas fonticola]|uniref:DNA-deoxyinosine glycosylase n=1 Tax=Herminiimonas fonticola TaxID=303380 RepID=UPI00334240FA